MCSQTWALDFVQFHIPQSITLWMVARTGLTDHS